MVLKITIQGPFGYYRRTIYAYFHAGCQAANLSGSIHREWIKLWFILYLSRLSCKVLLETLGSVWRTGLPGLAVLSQWQRVKDWFDWSSGPYRWTWSVHVLSGLTMVTAPTETATWNPAQRLEVIPLLQYTLYRNSGENDLLTCLSLSPCLSVCLSVCPSVSLSLSAYLPVSLYFQSMIPVGIKSGNFNKVGLLTLHITVNTSMLF